MSAQEVGWAYVAPAGQGAMFQPSANYQHTSSGQNVTVTRGTQDHRFIVQFPGVAPGSGGSVHATAYGGNHTAVVHSWVVNNGAANATIDLYDVNGHPANDAPFTVSWRYEGGGERREAYVWANSPNSPSYTPHTVYSWNGNRPDPTITRSAVGTYQVKFPGLAASGPELGHVQITPHGSLPVRAKVTSWSHSNGDVLVNVRCFGFSGTAVDAKFVCSYNETAAPIDAAEGSGAYVWANDSASSYYTPNPAYTDSNGLAGPTGDERIRRLSTGRYEVSLPNVVPSLSTNVQVTAQGHSPHYASVGSWGSDGCGGTRVVVDTYDTTGAPADTRFNLLYLTNRPAAKPEIAWVAVNPANEPATFTPVSQFQFSTAGQTITVDRGNAPNQFHVNIPGAAPSLGGSVHATARNGNHIAVVNGWSSFNGDVKATIELFDAFGNPANDKNFSVFWRHGGNKEHRQAYTWASQSATPSYTPSTIFTFNGDRGAPTITRTGTGLYVVTFPNLGSTGPEYGNVQVTPFGTEFLQAKVASWGVVGSDLEIEVRCFDAAGDLADGRFIVSYNETAAWMAADEGSCAHVWGHDPVNASYTPNSYFTDSNGTFGPDGAETIDRLGVGRYRVNLPNLAASDSTSVQVTAFGTGSEYATVDLWNSGGPIGTQVIVRTWAENGSPADARFSLLYVSDDPAVTPASNVVIGSGCNGATLVAQTRPVLCKDWDLSLTGVPASAVLGFVQLDLSNPSLSLGANAPGCTVYTGGAATVLILPPIPDPTYALAIPNHPSFIGVSIFAQGGAFVPNVNPYSVIASNGIEGRIGDY